MKNSMSFGAKLMAGFGAVMVLMVAVSAAAILVIQGLSADINYVVNRSAQARKVAQVINRGAAVELGAERGIQLRSILQQQAEVQKHKNEYLATKAEVEKSLNELDALSDTPEARSKTAAIRGKHADLARAHDEMMSALDKQQFEVVQKISDERVQPRAAEILADSEVLVRIMSEATKAANEKALGRAQTGYWIIGAMIALTALVGAGLWLFVRSSTTTLRDLAHEMSAGAGQVASAAAQVADSSQSLAQSASEQAATLEETAASSQHLAVETRANLEHTQGASDSVSVADQQISGANKTLEHMVGSMQEITASSSKISRIIKVIDEIAFQTNILALNAAVEAARAGEAGMGFAVVADEVRNLAQRCAQAAKDTAELIEESIAKSNGGQTKLGEVVQSIKAITESSANIQSLVGKVASSSREQSRSIEQISGSVTQMQKVTQSTAASAEQSAAASQEMSAQAASMKDAVDRLLQMVGGAKQGASSKARPSSGVRREVASSQSPSRRASTSSNVATADPFPMEDEFREF